MSVRRENAPARAGALLSSHLASAARLATWSWLGVGLVFVAIALGGFAGADRWPITAPIIAIATATAAFFFRLGSRSRRSVVFEIGALYFGIVALYALFPLIGNILSEGIYTELSDARMLRYGVPTPADIGSIAWMYFTYLSAFGLAYLIARGDRELDTSPVRRPATTVLVAFVLFLIGAELFGIYLRIAYDLHPTTYAESYLVISQLPLLVRQINVFAVGGAFVAKLGILLILFLDFKKNKAWIALWLLAVIASAFIQAGGERSSTMFLFLAATILYHHVVRPLKPSTIVVIGLAGFTIYLTLGILRAFGSARLVNPFGFTDFDGVFANAFDLVQRKRAGEVHLDPLRMYLGDLFAFVPQQFLPFPKFGGADWYMQEFYPRAYAQGAGQAFGAIAEGIIGAGLVELAVRGAIVGLGFAMIHRFVAGRMSFWWLLFYVWTMVYAYQSFRASTNIIINFTVFRFLPPILIARGIAGLLQAATRPRRALAQ